MQHFVSTCALPNSFDQILRGPRTQITLRTMTGSLSSFLPDSLSDKPFTNKIPFKSLNFIINQRNANTFVRYYILVITLVKIAMKPLSVDRGVKNTDPLKVCWWGLTPWAAIRQKS